MHSLFRQYPNGFDNFGQWCDHHVEMHKRHPLGCAEFGWEWCRRWEALGKLLESPGRVQRKLGSRQWESRTKASIYPVGTCLEIAIVARERNPNARLRVIVDGTIIREWGAS